MKKIISVILALALIFSYVSVFCAETDNMEKVLLSVKHRIPKTEEYENFSSRMNTYKEKTTYHFEWYTQKENDYSSLQVSTTASGIITSYSVYDKKESGDYKPSFNKITSKDALKKAEALVSSINPELADKIKIYNPYEKEDLYSDRFYFELRRYENGLPVLSDSGSVTVDANGDKILNYYINWTENAEFEPIDKILTKEEAKEAYKKAMPLKLSYRYNYKNKKREIFPGYTPSEEANTYLDAQSGEIIKISFSSDEASKEMVNDTLTFGSANQGAGFSPTEMKELEQINSLKSEDELNKIIYSNKHTSPDKEYEKTQFSLSRDSYDEDTYYAHFTFEKRNDGYGSISCTLNAKNGEILRYNKYEDTDYKNNSQEVSNASEIAESIAKELAPAKFNEYRKEKENGNSVNYVRYVNEIPTPDRINITLNKYTGELSSYSISYTTAEFPDISKAISSEDATDKMFEAVEFYPCYVISESKGIAVYNVKSPVSVIIDPFSGKLLNYDNSEYEEDKPPVYNDISGHWAEDIIKKLAIYGIGFYESDFRPDDYITGEEYISLLVSSFVSNRPILMRNDYDKSSEIKLAAERSILKDGEDISQNLTRQMAAVYMIRIIGAEKYAQIEGIYKSLFPDVSEYTGYISILSGMGIMNGDASGKFNPKKNLTRAQAVTIIHNALEKEIY